MRLSTHAKKRWEERFPSLDPQTEWVNSRRVGKRLRRQIGRKCPGNKRYALGMFSGRYYLLSKGGVVFVVAPPETVITVLKSVDIH